jgi:hypothetical protein
MSDESLVTIEPFAVRVPEAMRLDGCRTTEFYRRLKAGEYESFVDGSVRMVTVRSIRARQQRALAASNASGDKPARRAGPGGPRKTTSS